MKSVILYGSWDTTTRVTAGHQFKARMPGVPGLLIRAEVVDMDCLEALNSAKPEDGETVLNTMPIMTIPASFFEALKKKEGWRNV